MNYNLNDITAQQQKASTLSILGKLLLLIKDERQNLLLALTAILINSGLNLLNPFIVGYTIDKYIVHKNYHGVLMNAGLLVCMAVIAFGASYCSNFAMRCLLNCRNYRLHFLTRTKREI